MTGSARLKTKILIPEGDEDVVDRLQLDATSNLPYLASCYSESNFR
jgi:hypothetical protein